VSAGCTVQPAHPTTSATAHTAAPTTAVSVLFPVPPALPIPLGFPLPPVPMPAPA
jgi:hypothetical protein